MVSVLFMFFYLNKFRYKFRNDDCDTFPLFRARFALGLRLGKFENELTRWEINLLNME